MNEAPPIRGSLPRPAGVSDPASSPTPASSPAVHAPEGYTNQLTMPEIQAPVTSPTPPPPPPLPGVTDLATQAPDLLPVLAQERLAELFPLQKLDLTPEELKRVQVYQQSQAVLGAAGAAPATCAPTCPWAVRCPLFQMHKAPFGSLCPFEAQHVVERFCGWLKEFNRTELTINETERSSIATLVSLDLQEMRCNNILALGEAVKLTSLVVRDSNVDESGKVIPLAWEEVIHACALRLDAIIQERRGILRDCMKTEEQKAKLKRLEGRAPGGDMASRQSSAADKIRRVQEGEVIDVTPVDP